MNPFKYRNDALVISFQQLWNRNFRRNECITQLGIRPKFPHVFDEKDKEKQKDCYRNYNDCYHEYYDCDDDDAQDRIRIMCFLSEHTDIYIGCYCVFFWFRFGKFVKCIVCR